MDKYDGTTSNLHISQKNLNCKKVADALFKSGVCSHVTSNDSIQYNYKTKQYEQEKGCSIILCGLNKKHIINDVWNPLKDKFNLSCAHLEIVGQYKGCILNFIRIKDCP